MSLYFRVRMSGTSGGRRRRRADVTPGPRASGGPPRGTSATTSGPLCPFVSDVPLPSQWRVDDRTTGASPTLTQYQCE